MCDIISIVFFPSNPLLPLLSLPQINQILDGTAKANITHWWLNEIESNVDEYLESLGMKWTLSDDYINSPPKDPLQVKNIESVHMK